MVCFSTWLWSMTGAPEAHLGRGARLHLRHSKTASDISIDAAFVIQATP